jgi:hypothetical protein
MVGSRTAMSPEEPAVKKEGAYLTGLPLASFDPNYGFGFGARGNLFFNGSRDGPLFAYAPYQHRVSLTLFGTTKGLQFHWLDYDAPFLGDSAYRLRAQGIFEENIDRHHFGIGERTLAPLRYPGESRTFGKLDDYEASQRRALPDGSTYSKYDRFFFRRPAAIVSVERSLVGGRLRPLAGFALTRATIRDYAGDVVEAEGPSGTIDSRSAATRLTEDCARNAIVGCAGGWDNFIRLGVAFDTRDYEPDPTSGVFVDAGADLGTTLLGSRYPYARVVTAARVYVSPFPRLTRLVVALRAFYQAQTQGTPFFSMNVIPFTEDPKTGLGGFRTLRGYSQDRFVGPVMAAGNAEIRWTFFTFDVLRQHFGLMVVPFVDAGRVFDSIGRTRLAGFRHSGGSGLRIAWNQATIVMADYGVSPEGSALYVNFSHIF